MESESVCPRFLQPARGLTPSPYYTTSQKLTVDPSCLTYILSHMSFERRLVPTIHQIRVTNTPPKRAVIVGERLALPRTALALSTHQ